MKKSYLYTLLSAILLVGIVTLNSCKKDDDPSVSDRTKSTLAARSWKVSKVTVSGTDQTALFSGLTLQLKGDNTYTATDGYAIFSTSGTWAFKDESATALIMSLRNHSEAEVAIQSVTSTDLVLALSWDETTIGQGRVNSVEGQYTFEFKAE